MVTKMYRGQDAVDQLAGLEGTVIGLQHVSSDAPTPGAVLRHPLDGTTLAVFYNCPCDPEHCRSFRAVEPMVQDSQLALEEDGGAYTLRYHMNKGAHKFINDNLSNRSLLDRYRPRLESHSFD